MERLAQLKKPRRMKWMIALFLAALFAAGVAGTFSYGQPWDEGLEKEILLSNLREYAVLTGWENRVDALSSLDLVGRISESTERDHGMAAYYAFFPIYERMGDQTLVSMYAWHMYTFGISFVGAISVMLILKELYTSPLIWFAGTLSFFLTPRFFAESHYNNMDLTFISIILGMLLFLIRAAGNPSWKNLVPYAVFSGFLMNCRTPGIAIWAFGGFFLLAYQVIHHRPGKAIGKILGGFLLSVLFYYVLTPASWGDPVGFLKYCLENATHYTEWNKVIVYNGNMIQPAANGLPYSYLPKWILMTTPEHVLLLFAVSSIVYSIRLAGRVICVIRRDQVPVFTDRDYFAGMLLLLFWLPFAYLVYKSPSLVLYNGWRHCYFLYAPIILLFLYALDPESGIKKKKVSRMRVRLLSCVLILGLLSCAADLIHFHPYEYVYFNRIARNTLSVQGFEGDYWNVSVLGAVRHFEDEFYQGKKLKVALMVDAWGGQTETILNSEKLQIVSEAEADYFLFTTSALNNRMLTCGYKLVSGVEIDGYLISGVYTRE